MSNLSEVFYYASNEPKLEGLKDMENAGTLNVKGTRDLVTMATNREAYVITG